MYSSVIILTIMSHVCFFVLFLDEDLIKYGWPEDIW